MPTEEKAQADLVEDRFVRHTWIVTTGKAVYSLTFESSLLASELVISCFWL